MTKFTEDLVRVVDFGIVVSVWRVWYIADMFMSPADEPRYAKNSFALAAGLVSQCSSNSSFTWVYVGAPRWSSKNLLTTFQHAGGRHSRTSSAFLFSLVVPLMRNIISAR